MDGNTGSTTGFDEGNGGGSAGLKGPRPQRGTVQSVDRALSLLELLARSSGGTPLTELAAGAGLNISTCHHLLATLVKWGYVKHLV